MAFLDRVRALFGALLDRARALFGPLDREGATARALALARDGILNFDLDSALVVARTLASALDLERAHVPDQARDLVGDLVRDLDKALGTGYPVHRDHALNRAAAAARDLDHALGLALGALDGDYAPDRAAARDLDPSQDLASALASALTSYHALVRTMTNYPELARDRAFAVARYCDLARGLARYLDHLSVAPVDAESVVEAAVRWLPLAWQSRYREEYRAELAELPPDERDEYARQVLADVLELRKELTETEGPPDSARVKE